jgi:hypothetical protein
MHFYMHSNLHKKNLFLQKVGVTSCDGMENMVTLLAWECDSHLYGAQKLEVHLHATGHEHEAGKMARVDQGL